MKATRSYDMTNRAQAARATRTRILESVRAIAYERLEFAPTLEAVAAEAGVSVQTVLRHFSTRDAMLRAATAAATAGIVEERRPPSPDIDAAITTLIEHYELRGDFVLAMLAREGVDANIAAVTDAGKREHRRWVGEVFGDAMPADADAREVLLDLLVVATDVYAWKLLRRDRGHDVPTVHARMRTMTDALLTAPPRGTPCPPH